MILPHEKKTKPPSKKLCVLVMILPHKYSKKIKKRFHYIKCPLFIRKVKSFIL